LEVRNIGEKYGVNQVSGENLPNSSKGVEILKKLYMNWVQEDRIFTPNIFSSELGKLVSNAFLAQRISSINSIAAICEKTGADIEEGSLRRMFLIS